MEMDQLSSSVSVSVRPFDDDMNEEDKKEWEGIDTSSKEKCISVIQRYQKDGKRSHPICLSAREQLAYLSLNVRRPFEWQKEGLR
jgi:hypothetical protein